MLEQLDIAIGFVVVMLMLSLIVTAAVQAIGALLDLRGKNLARALAELFRQIDPDLGAIRTKLSIVDRTKYILQHPFSRASAAAHLADGVTTHPILAHTFTRAKAVRKDELLDVLRDIYFKELIGRFDAGIQSKVKEILGSQFPDGIKTAEAAEALATKVAEKFPGAKGAVKTAALEMLAKLSYLEAGVQKWFDRVMDRSSDVFTRWTRTITIAISVLLVAGLHIDAGHILHQISTSPEIKVGLNKISDAALAQSEEITAGSDRGSLALKEFIANRNLAIPENVFRAAPQLRTCAQAVTWLGEHSPVGTNAVQLKSDFADACEKQAAAILEASQKRIKKLQDDLAHSELKIVPDGVFGADTDAIAGRFATWRNRYVSDPRHMLGTLAMVVLLSLGAPFWYNALKEFSNLKPAITQKVEKESPTSPNKKDL
jgi:hypothetical protein